MKLCNSSITEQLTVSLHINLILVENDQAASQQIDTH